LNRTWKERGRFATKRLIGFFSKHPAETLLVALILIVISLVPRLLLPGWDVSPNGVDEGIQIMAGRMYSTGYELYSQVNTVQPPIMLSLYGALGADHISYRLLSVLCSMVIIGLVMWGAHRIGGKNVMIASGAFLVMDIVFLQESRLASLDMFSLMWVAASIPFVILFRERGRTWPLIVAGGLIGISSMTKLFGTIAGGVIFLLLAADLLAGHSRFSGIGRALPPKGEHRVRWYHLMAYVLSMVVVVLMVMSHYGIPQVFEGIVLNQMHRPVQGLTTKLWVLVKYGLPNLFMLICMVPGLKRTYRTPLGVVVFVTFVYLVYFMAQASTFLHHMIFLSPALTLSAGVGFDIMIKGSRRLISLPRGFASMSFALLVFAAAAVGTGFSMEVVERGEPAQYDVADIVEANTEEDDFVISGDPLIPYIADRSIPPSVVNVAHVQYPEITSDQLNRTTVEYGVRCVVLTYRLSEMEGFVDFISEHYVLRYRIRDVLDPDSEDRVDYLVFLLSEDSTLDEDPGWGSLREPPRVR